MSTADFLKQQVGVFKSISDARLKELVEGSRVASFESREAIAHCGGRPHILAWC
jgi:hypothetical protein